MSNRTAVPFDPERDEAAAYWLLRLKSPGLSEAETAEWLHWCEADPRNRQAFEAMAEVWEIAGDLDAAAFVQQAKPPANDDSREPEHGWGLVRYAAIAAGLAAIIAATLFLQLWPIDRPEKGLVAIARLETPIGRVQTTTLDDGSRIELGGKSSLSVRYSPVTRLIVADEGEAFFSVASNPDRPFVVQAGPVTVTAVGTAFSVQRDGNVVVVNVTEGVVEVRATPSLRPGRTAAPPTVLRASAGHQVRFDRGVLSQSVETAQADIVAPWREGRLEFRDEPLSLVVARINRYSPMQLEIGDPAIADLRVTTIVYHDRVDAWLDGVATVLPVRVSRVGDDRAIISPAT